MQSGAGWDAEWGARLVWGGLGCRVGHRVGGVQCGVGVACRVGLQDWWGAGWGGRVGCGAVPRCAVGLAWVGFCVVELSRVGYGSAGWGGACQT